MPNLICYVVITSCIRPTGRLVHGIVRCWWPASSLIIYEYLHQHYRRQIANTYHDKMEGGGGGGSKDMGTGRTGRSDPSPSKLFMIYSPLFHCAPTEGATMEEYDRSPGASYHSRHKKNTGREGAAPTSPTVLSPLLFRIPGAPRRCTCLDEKPRIIVFCVGLNTREGAEREVLFLPPPDP